MNTLVLQSGDGIDMNCYLRIIMTWVMLVSTFSARELMAQEKVLVIHPVSSICETVIKGIKRECLNELEVLSYQVDNKTTSTRDLKVEIERVNPKLVVLMDNYSITLFKEYQNEVETRSEIIPSISLLAVTIEDAIKGIPNSTGISYEIPIVSSIIQFRKAFPEHSIEKIGVVHREFMRNYVDKNRVFCSTEHIDVVNAELSNDEKNVARKIKKHLKSMIETDSVEAIWVPNDIALLNGETIKAAWRPITKKYRIPLIVGVENFVKPQINVGTFAVIPDLESLGSQAGTLILDAMDNNWILEKHTVEEPLAVYSVLNLKHATKYFSFDLKNLYNVNKVLK